MDCDRPVLTQRPGTLCRFIHNSILLSLLFVLSVNAFQSVTRRSSTSVFNFDFPSKLIAGAVKQHSGCHHSSIIQPTFSKIGIRRKTGSLNQLRKADDGICSVDTSPIDKGRALGAESNQRRGIATTSPVSSRSLIETNVTLSSQTLGTIATKQRASKKTYNNIEFRKRRENGQGHSNQINAIDNRTRFRANTTKIVVDSVADKKPWKANYYISLKSQEIIKDAAANTKDKTPIERATAVLEAFLSIPQDRCNVANVVCALTLSAKVISRETNDNLRSLLHRTIDILARLVDEKSLTARQLCNAVWAIAKHYDRDTQLLPALPEPVPMLNDNVVGQAETWDLRFDLAGCPARRVDETIDEIASQITSLLSEDYWSVKESELCMASWAYGILRRRRRPAGWRHGPQLGAVSINSETSINNSPPKQQYSDDFIKFEQWQRTSTDELIDSSTDVLANNLPTPSRTGLLFDKIGEALCQSTSVANITADQGHQRIRSCQWSELANLVWAFASHGRSHTHGSQTLLSAIATEASRRLRSDPLQAKLVLSRDIAQIVWALGTLQSDNFRLADSLIEFIDAVCCFTQVDKIPASDRPLRGWSCADIVQVTSSLAHARLDEIPLLTALFTESLHRMDVSSSPTASSNRNNFRTLSSLDRRSFLAWEISVLLWAQARLFLKFPDNPIFAAFADKAINSLKSVIIQRSSFDRAGLGAQEQANIAWSLTVLELYNHDAVDLQKLIFTEAASACEKQGIIQLEHAHQLWQALCLLEEQYPDIVKDVPPWFRLYLQDKWEFEKSRTKISSARHKSLSNTLKLMGVAHINEHDEDIDVAIVLKARASWTHETDDVTSTDGVKIAVEFDGPNHFTRQRIPKDGSKPEPPRALGHTVLKYRQLKKQGWTVVRVPYYEFDKIPFWASMERQRYLQRLLKTHGNIRFSTVDVSEYKPQLPTRKSRFD